MAPKVSVVMAVHNGERYLKESIESILTQTFADFEFLIVDDGSTDSTGNILVRYADRDARIRLITNEDNIGLTKSLNKGIGLARGDYIARMDADDISLLERLGKQADYLDAHPDVGVLGAAVQLLDSSGKVGDTWTFPEEHGFLKWSLCFFYNPIVHPTVMVRRKILRQAGGYNEEMAVSQDYDLWCRLIHLTRFGNLQKVLLLLRKHESNITHLRFEEQRENALKVNQVMTSMIVGENLPEVNMLSFWKVVFSPNNATANDRRQAIMLIYRLVRVFLRDCSLSIIEKTKIRSDAYVRLDCLLKQQKFRFRMLSVWIWVRMFDFRKMIMKKVHCISVIQ